MSHGARMTPPLEHLWAPWRSAYVKEAKALAQAGCLFCGLATTDDPRGHHVLMAGERAIVVLNLFPYATGHLMVAPRQHAGSPTAADAATLQEFFGLVVYAERVLRRVYRPDGMNVGMNLGEAAGAGVPSHFHMHLVPRWSGDTNFMAAVGGTRVHPEGLEATMEKLWPYFAQGPLPEGHALFTEGAA